MNQIDFSKVAREMTEIGLMPDRPDSRMTYTYLPDAADVLRRGFAWAAGDDYEWIPEYEEVAEWLSDNKGRGLIMFGDCGRGKSLLGKYILPMIFKYYLHKIMNVYTVQELNSDIDNVINKHIIYIDDVGLEGVSNQFGNKRMAFSELVDAVESKGKLLVFSTNLSLEAIEEKYGLRTIDRLRAVTTQIFFEGKSLRK